MSDDRPETELPEFPDEAVLLDETSYSTNIHEYVKDLVQQGVASEEWKFWIVQSHQGSIPRPLGRKKCQKVAVSYSVRLRRSC